ncbi:hypothetical protein JL720_11925 [Aureococcus anophagefferens]|nr:hypothetical protein JL720_11925 [Aureococcus anophagefferens]
MDEERAERNPFTLPSDEEVFRMRDEERKRRSKEREEQRKLKVWQKTTGGSRVAGSVRLKELIGGDGREGAAASKSARQTKDAVNEARSIVMSLDTKREEIRKLEEKAQMKEEALKKSEQMLEEDAIRFDTFLKENDKKAHEAIKKAEKETKLKTDKVQEIKRLNQQIQMLRLEEAEAAPKKKYGAGRRRKSVAGADPSKAVAPKMPPPVATPELEDEPLTSSDEELPMYFKHPQQLLDIFSQLEEQNLFLIQNSQETEKALEELKQNFEATKEQMDGKTALSGGRLQARAGETQGRQEKLLAQLHEKVRDVYQKCGFDVGSKPSTLFMLSELEARLEQLLDHIETMSEEYIMKEEKDKEKKRRERKRQEQQALQDAQQEERNRKSIARSMQAPKKRTGRQVMFRSAPMRQAVREEKEEEDDDLDELKYLT